MINTRTTRTMKGQSAIEYLMSYGWMLLVVAIIGGAIFAFVGNRCITQASGFNAEEVSVQDFAITSDQQLVLEIENRGSDSLDVKNITLASEGDSMTEEVSEDLSSGESKNMAFSQAFEPSDSCRTYDAIITYDRGQLTDLSISGTVTGAFNLIDSPVSPEIEDVEN